MLFSNSCTITPYNLISLYFLHYNFKLITYIMFYLIFNNF